MVREEQLESEECEDALDTEGPSIDKVTVEQIWIRFRWKSVLIKNVHKIEELAVNVTTDGELAVVRNLHIDERWLFAKEGIHVVEDLIKTR